MHQDAPGGLESAEGGPQEGSGGARIFQQLRKHNEASADCRMFPGGPQERPREESGEPQGTNMSLPRKPREGPKEGDSRQPGPQDRTGGRQEVARTGRTPAGRFGKIAWRLGRISGRLGKIPGRLGKIHWAPSPAARFEAVF